MGISVTVQAMPRQNTTETARARRISPEDVARSMTMLPIDSISRHPENNNIGAENAIGESIEEFGFFDPVIVQQSTGFIISGNHRWEQLRARGATEIPALVYDVDDFTAKRMMLAVNRTGRLGHDDPAKTAALLAELLDATDDDGAAGLAGTGWTATDLADLHHLVAPPDLDDLIDTIGEYNESDAWPVLRIKVPRHARDAFHALTAARAGDDSDRFLHLLTLAGWDPAAEPETAGAAT